MHPSTMLGCMTFSATERRNLADLFLEVGPDAPTLCEGWTTKDLATHLLIREHRPLAAAGMFVPLFKGQLDKTTAAVEQRPYEDIVGEWAAGPGRLSPARYADRLMNTTEHFIHHEDVRRGGGTYEKRDFSEAVNDELYGSLKMMAPRLLKNSEVPVILAPAGRERIVCADKRGVAENGEAVVRVSGDVGELLLWVFGRDAADVDVEGNAGDVRKSGV
ncbi:hypothetical protein CATRI_07835 [Corynebacterium atrinae]|nr:hypothetical protein CATRI_07835 [Corynebacterium atrinae]